MPRAINYYYLVVGSWFSRITSQKSVKSSGWIARQRRTTMSGKYPWAAIIRYTVRKYRYRQRNVLYIRKVGMLLLRTRTRIIYYNLKNRFHSVSAMFFRFTCSTNRITVYTTSVQRNGLLIFSSNFVVSPFVNTVEHMISSCIVCE